MGSSPNARPKIKVKGVQSQWYVEAGDLGRIATCHGCYITRAGYCYDHKARQGDKVDPSWLRKHDELVSLLREKKLVVLTQDEVTEGDPLPTIRRTGYSGIFSIDDVNEVDGVLTFRLVERIADVV